MQIRVEMTDGEKRTITLVPPITLTHGEWFRIFHCGDGTKHFFTPDGYYDGWGREVGAEDNPEQIIEGMESDQRGERAS